MKRILLFILLAISLICFSQSDAGVVMKAGTAAGATDYTADGNCQGAWLFDDDLTDESGEGNTLTASGFGNGPDYQATRPSGYSTGKSIHFDGSDDYVTRAFADLSANFPGKVQKEDMAVCLWVYHDDDAGGNESVMGLYYSWHAIQNYWHSSGFDDVHFRVYDDDPADYPWECDVMPDAEWRHYCFSFDGSATEGRIWISTEAAFGNVNDGTTPETFTNINFVRETNTPFNIGEIDGSEWDGYVYQPIVFDRTINATEAEAIYTTGITGVD